ncbi:MAG: hypothetical protein RJA57_246, partial [Bacteroidota bacterium]
MIFSFISEYRNDNTDNKKDRQNFILNRYN